MSQFLPNVENADHAAAILSLRLSIAQQTGGVTKEAGWKENVDTFVQNLMKQKDALLANLKRKPDLTGDAQNYWGNVGWESLRNALIGAGVGGVGGVASSLFSKRRKKDPWGKLLRGALLGAAAGGGGTAAYRGAEYARHGGAAAEAEANRLADEKAEADYQAAEAEARSANRQRAQQLGAGQQGKQTTRGGQPAITPGITTWGGNQPARLKRFLGAREFGEGAEEYAQGSMQDMYGPDAGVFTTAGAIGGAGLGAAVDPALRRWNAVKELASRKDPGADLGRKELPHSKVKSRIPKPMRGKGKSPTKEVLQGTVGREFWRPWKRLTYMGRVQGVPGYDLKRARQPVTAKRRIGGQGLPALFGALGMSQLGAKIDAARAGGP